MQTFPVAITGAFSSGKTKFIQTLSEIEVVSFEFTVVESNLRVGMDFGRLSISSDIVMYFFANPGARRFPIREFNERMKRLVPYLLLINPKKNIDQRLSPHAETKYIYQELKQAKVPHLIVANRRKDVDSYSIGELCEMLQVSETTRFLECDLVTEPASAKRVLIELFNLLPHDELVQAAIEKLSENKEELS